MSDNERGWYLKYRVQKLEGETDPNADYFVLRLDTDPHARKAALVYAESIREENPRLSVDLYLRLTRLDEREKEVSPDE